jgi:hypothetical protein
VGGKEGRKAQQNHT